MKKLLKNTVIGLCVIAVVVAILISAKYVRSEAKKDVLQYKEPGSIQSASNPKTVNLKDGQVYNIKAGFVTKDIDGVEQNMLAYNNSIPGPTLKVKQGSEATLKFTNEINLESTINAHGLRQDIKMDGMVPYSQDPVKEGDTFSYKWKFDTPGIYWYHPTTREDYQQGTGLYGTIMVEPKEADYWPLADESETLVLSDVLTDETTGIIKPFNKVEADKSLMGRYGNIVLINGDSSWEGKAKVNSVKRYYLVNASSARPYVFSLKGVQMKVVGSDSGRVGVERIVDELIIGPGERYVVDVLFSEKGKVNIVNDAPENKSDIGEIDVAENPKSTIASLGFPDLRTNQDVVNSISELAQQVTGEKHLSLTLSLGKNSSLDIVKDKTESILNTNESETDPYSGINWKPLKNNGKNNDATWQIADIDESKSNSQVEWKFKKGDVVRIRINNYGETLYPVQHPIYIHGQRFSVASINGLANPNVEWKDTVLIPSGTEYELLVVMDNPGQWIISSQTPSHFENGMFIKFKVS